MGERLCLNDPKTTPFFASERNRHVIKYLPKRLKTSVFATIRLLARKNARILSRFVNINIQYLRR